MLFDLVDVVAKPVVLRMEQNTSPNTNKVSSSRTAYEPRNQTRPSQTKQMPVTGTGNSVKSMRFDKRDGCDGLDNLMGRPRDASGSVARWAEWQGGDGTRGTGVVVAKLSLLLDARLRVWLMHGIAIPEGAIC